MQTIASLPPRTTLPWIGQIGRPRIVLGAIALGLVAGAAAWQWSWLVAVGVAPLLVSAAPCVAMCGLGLCMHRVGVRSCTVAPADANVPRGALESPIMTQEM